MKTNLNRQYNNNFIQNIDLGFNTEITIKEDW